MPIKVYTCIAPCTKKVELIARKHVEHIRDRWGESITTGAFVFAAVPNVLIRNQ